MPIRLLFVRRLGVMDDSDEPVPIPPNVEDHVSIDVIGILEHLAHFREIVPANRLNYDCPGFDLTRRILVLLHGLTQMPGGNNMHFFTILHNL